MKMTEAKYFEGNTNLNNNNCVHDFEIISLLAGRILENPVFLFWFCAGGVSWRNA